MTTPYHMFRCWNKETQRMCSVIKTELVLKPTQLTRLFVSNNAHDDYVIEYTGNDNGVEFKVDREDVMLCSGVLDSTGENFIYEGDIVERLCLDTECDITHRGVVLYNTVWGTFQIRDGSTAGQYAGYNPLLVHGSINPNMFVPLHVLGNILENRNLLTSE